MEKKKFGLTAIAVIVAVSVLVLFQFIAMLDAYTQNRGGGTFDIMPIGYMVAVLAMSGLTVLFLIKGKPLLAALLILLTYVIDRGLDFITNLINNQLDFSTASGFGALLILGALVFLVVALVLERKKLQMPKVSCLFKTPYLLLLLIFLGHRLLFVNTQSTIFALVILFMIVAFEEEKFLPLVIASFTVIQFFLMIDDFIDLANSRGGWGAPSNVAIVAHVTGTLILAFAIVMFFIPNLFQKKAVAGPVGEEKMNDEAEVDVVEPEEVEATEVEDTPEVEETPEVEDVNPEEE